jgi:DNA-binding CsgD family transcriptional regulator
MGQAPDTVTDEALIDAIYEAAVVPEHWPDVLHRVAMRVEAAHGTFFSYHGDVTQYTGSPLGIELIDDYVAAGAGLLNTRSTRAIARHHPGFLTDLDVFAESEIANEPFYRDFLYPRGYGWCAGSFIDVPSGGALVYSFERRFERGPIETPFVAYLDTLRPHLARAAVLAAQLGLQRARAMAQALEVIGLPAAVLRVGGTVHAANFSFGRLIPDVAQDRRERLVLTDRTADGLFVRALAALRQQAPGPVQSIPVAARDERPPMVVHVLPVKGAAHDIFSQSGSIVVVTPVDRAAVVTAEVLQGLFDLTPAEARAARAVGEGRSVGEIASAGGVSEETVRTHVKAVLSKTGLNRQAELVALLAGTSLPAAGSK